MKKFEEREQFQRKIASKIRYANGYYYLGDYQPATNTGRYETRDELIKYQMDCWDTQQQDGK